MTRLYLCFVLLCSTSSALASLCVTADGVSLHTGPGNKYPVSWKVSKYTPLAEIKGSGGWIEVEDMDGEHHWIYGSHVTRRLVCVSVRTNTAKLRKAAGPQAELADIKQVDRYTSFKRVDSQDEWYEVEASWGETYWINESMVWRPLKISKLSF